MKSAAPEWRVPRTSATFGTEKLLSAAVPMHRSFEEFFQTSMLHTRSNILRDLDENLFECNHT